MKSRLPLGLYLVALFQWVAPLILPPDILQSVSLSIWIAVAAVFALLGFFLLIRRAMWARVATIFVQGFSLIIRLLILISHTIEGGEVGGALAVTFVATSVASMLLSALILYYVDQPDVQLIMQQSAS